MSWRVLVVDDEPAARSGLAAMVRADPDFADVRESGDRDSAVHAIREARPHLILLDVQLNPGTGFEVIEQVGAAAMPLVVFVTAFDHFAVRAFDTAAVDYVVKPVAPDRLATALMRAKVQLRQAGATDVAAHLTALMDAVRTPVARPFAVADGERTLLFEPEEIVWVEAADYYAKIHARGRAWLVRETLDALEARLPAPPFFRIHRSAIVNLHAVTEVVRVSRHRHAVVLRDQSRLPVSEERRKALDGWLLSHGSTLGHSPGSR